MTLKLYVRMADTITILVLKMKKYYFIKQLFFSFYYMPGTLIEILL